MEDTKTPRAVRQLVILSVVCLVVSLIISGVNAYVAFASPLALNTFPTSVGFEGQLMDSSGSPITGAKNLTFKLYDEASGSHAVLWSEIQTVDLGNNGLYSVQLGSTPGHSLSPSDFQGDRWLGVTVEGAAELGPRIKVTSVPWALNAVQAYGLQGRSVSGTTPNDGDALVYNSGSGAWEPRAGIRYGNVPSVRVYNTSNVTGSGLHALSFDSVRFDTNTLFDPANNTRLTAHTPGKYLIFGHATSVTLEYSPPTGMYMQIRLNADSTIIAQQTYTTTTNQTATGRTGYFSISTVYQLNQNDYVELWTNRNVVAAGNYSPEFGMIWIGD